MKQFFLAIVFVFGFNTVSLAEPASPPQETPSLSQAKAPKLKPAPPIKWQRSSQCGKQKS